MLWPIISVLNWPPIRTLAQCPITLGPNHPSVYGDSILFGSLVLYLESPLSPSVCPTPLYPIMSVPNTHPLRSSPWVPPAELLLLCHSVSLSSAFAMTQLLTAENLWHYPWLPWCPAWCLQRCLVNKCLKECTLGKLNSKNVDPPQEPLRVSCSHKRPEFAWGFVAPAGMKNWSCTYLPGWP